MSTASDPKAIYEAGFSTCLESLLKKDDVEDILPMKLTNSMYTMRKFSKTDGEKQLELDGISVTANQDFMDAMDGDGNYYASVQAINNDANPYKNESLNNVEISSKIVSMSVRSSGKNSVEKVVKLADEKFFPIKFDQAPSGAKCGYYDLVNKKWVEDGELSGNTCSFI